MSRIAFIAPDKEMYERGRKFIRELNIEHKFQLYLARHNKAVRIARELDAAGVDVIVSRGGTAQMISESGIKTPLVEIPVTGYDLAHIIYRAKQLTGLERVRITVVGFPNMVNDIESLSHIMGIDLSILILNTKEEIPAKVDLIQKETTDIVVGGITTTRYAARKGFKTLLIISGDNSFKVAFLEAEKVAYGRKVEKERAQTFRVLVDYSMEGIISVDREERIHVFNSAAERLLGIQVDRVLGKKISEVLPVFEMAECLNYGKECLGEILNQGNVSILTNLAPIKVEDQVTGVMITFQDISKIQEMEARIRKEVYTKGLRAKYHFRDIIGSSEEMLEIKRIAREFSLIDATVLILGPTGTGKELFAQSIHNDSPRHNGPFVAVNCGALPANLLESELFGYVEGAFTGANRKGKPGLFELAHGGTLFLDEISEMDKFAQSRLLRVLQERQVMRLGDDKNIPVDVRIIAASNRNLLTCVQEREFREDLFYRLNVLTLHLPPLRERSGDITVLADHFLKLYNAGFKKQIKLAKEAKQLLGTYEWPGNVRELQYFIEKLVVMTHEQTLSGEAMRKLMQQVGLSTGSGKVEPAEGKKQSADEEKKNKRMDIFVQEDISEKETVYSADLIYSEKARILTALQFTGYNQKEAAKLLGINRTTLYRKLKNMNIVIAKGPGNT